MGLVLNTQIVTRPSCSIALQAGSAARLAVHSATDGSSVYGLPLRSVPDVAPAPVML